MSSIRLDKSEAVNAFRLLRNLSLWVLLSVLVPGAPLAAQTTADLEQGMKPYGSYQAGDIDSVSFSNGGLVLHIPLLSYPQRGGKLKVDYWLGMNSLDIQIIQYCAPYVGCKYMALRGYGSGAPVVHDSLIGAATLKQYLKPDGTPTSIHYTDYEDPDFGIHQLAWTGGTAYESVDATSIHYDSSTQVLTYKDGTRESFTGGGLGAPGTPVAIEDTNGNKLTYNSAQSSWTDTVGRVLNLGVSTSDYTGCTGPLPVTRANTITAPNPQGGTETYKVCFASPSYSFSLLGNATSGTNSYAGLQSVVLPNGTAWTFTYEPTYAALSSITLPTGGTISYTWNPPVLPCGTTGYPQHWILPVKTRTVNANDGTGPQTWNYSWPSQFNSGTGLVTVTDPLGNDTLHNMTGLGGTCAVYETQTRYYQGHSSAGGLLKTVQTDYTYTQQNPNNYNTLMYNTAVNVVPIRLTTTWAATNKVSKVETDYDSGFSYTGNTYSGSATYGRVIARREYEYGTGAAGALVRKTSTGYVAPGSASYLTNHLLDLVSSVTVADGTGVQKAYTFYGYDEYSLTSSGIATQHDSAPPSGVARGNQTSIHRWLNGSTVPTTNCPVTVSNGYILSSAHFYDTGTVSQSTDPCNHSTGFSYSSTYAGAYLTQTTNPLLQSTTHTYDLNTGLLTSTVDPNGLTTTFNYDVMWRPAQVNYPDGGQESLTHQETSFPFTATLTKKLNSSQTKISTNVFDGLGRPTQSRLTSDPQGTIYADTTYDALGRLHSVSNPYRAGSDPTTSSGTTTYGYNALGQKTSETYPDGSALSTAYCATSTLVTDPTGRWRRSRADGLGRLVEVDEPNAPGAVVNSNGCPGTGEPIWITSYLYDTLGNLVSVFQNGSHQRNFTYDSISHLLTAGNPENGSITYAYDADGNLATKRDARNITITYGYDILNRPASRTYSNGDPSVTIAYDQSNCLGLTSCSNVGQRTSMTDAAGSEAWSYQVDSTSHRSVRVDQRTTLSGTTNITKTSTYYVDLAGNITSVTYPTGRVVNYSYDSADRPSTASDGASGITYATDFQSPPAGCLANAACYTPQGTFYALSIGRSSAFAGLNVTHTYNNRLQPNEFKASSTAGSAIDISYGFVDPPSQKNAGHVFLLTNNLNNSRTQSFTYDQVNRIVSAGTVATTGQYCWGYQYSYDAWGNLLSQSGWTPNYTGCTETVASATADGNNHLAGFGYDVSGNTTGDGNYSYSWNGESQLKSAAGVNYRYDGDGRRVSKDGSKLYWYGSGGEILAETNASGGTTAEYVFFSGLRIALLPAGGNPQYYIDDFLGSSRVVAQSNGVVCYDADFTPYGAERAYVNSCPQNKYKFEGKERDDETSNDAFGARYYTWRFGRWLSSDWSAAPVPVPYANLGNPQSLNLYSMVADDPESFADFDGHCWPPSECAHAVMDKVNQTQKWVEDKAVATGNPTVAAGATFASGVTRDIINGFAGLGTVGEASGAVWDSRDTTQRVLAAVEDGGKAGGIALLGVAVAGGPGAGAPKGDLLQPGPYAGESVRASGPRITSAEQAEVNRIGQESGCHSCGSMEPGTKRGDFVGDHQPPTSLNRNAAPQSLYPQCLQCSRIQGGQARAAQVAAAQQPQPPPKPVLPAPQNPQPGSIACHNGSSPCDGSQ